MQTMTKQETAVNNSTVETNTVETNQSTVENNSTVETFSFEKILERQQAFNEKATNGCSITLTSVYRKGSAVGQRQLLHTGVLAKNNSETIEFKNWSTTKINERLGIEIQRRAGTTKNEKVTGLKDKTDNELIELAQQRAAKTLKNADWLAIMNDETSPLHDVATEFFEKEKEDLLGQRHLLRLNATRNASTNDLASSLLTRQDLTETLTRISIEQKMQMMLALGIPIDQAKALCSEQ